MIFRPLKPQDILLILNIWTTPGNSSSVERTAKKNWKLLLGLQWEVYIGEDVSAIGRRDLKISQNFKPGCFPAQMVARMRHRLWAEIELVTDLSQGTIKRRQVLGVQVDLLRVFADGFLDL